MLSPCRSAPRTGWTIAAITSTSLRKATQSVGLNIDPQLLVSLLPDPEIITRTLQLPNAHLVGNDTLDGRPVVVIVVAIRTPWSSATSLSTKGVHIVQEYRRHLLDRPRDQSVTPILHRKYDSSVARKMGL